MKMRKMDQEFVKDMPIEPMVRDKYALKEFNTIGKRGIRRLDGYEKASGKAIFCRDVQLPGMLYAKILHSPYAHAGIKSMNTSKAEKFPGVRYVLRYDDPEIEKRKEIGIEAKRRWFGWGMPYYILGGTAYWQNEPVGIAVAADSEDIAREALRLVDIEWEELPFVLDQEEALMPSAPIARPDVSPDTNLWPPDPFKIPEVRQQGDVEKGFAESDKIIEFTGRRRDHLWAGPEPVSCLAEWKGDNLEIWVHHQHPYDVKLRLSEWFNIPISKIKVTTPYQGGMFGGWNWMVAMAHSLWVITAILAKRTGKPVKLRYSRKEEFYGESEDIMVSYFEVGAKNDGTITAVKIKTVQANVSFAGADHFADNTRIPNISFVVTKAYVNKGDSWSCRCEHNVNTINFNLVFDHVAAALRLDPTEVALKNDGCEGKDMNYLAEFKREHGFPDRDSLKECIEAGKKAIGWDEKWHPPGMKRLPNGKMHGMGFAWTHEWDSARGAGCAGVLIHRDGSVDIIGQKSDIGVNHDTTYAQIVADELGMRYEDINFRSFNDVGFELMTADGSANLCCNGYIVRKAARKAKQRLLELATTPILQLGELPIVHFPGYKAEDLDIKDSVIYVKIDPSKTKTVAEVVKITELTEVGMQQPVFAWVWHRQGKFGLEPGRHRLCRQAHFMEVEVDPETGEIEIKKVVNVNDVGKAISPETVEGQQYGGMYMAVGRSRSEEIVWDPRTGVMLNSNLLDYKIATMLDCGPIEPIIVETGMGYGPYGAEGIGENVACHAASLLGSAVHNAIGVAVDDFPITPDKVLKALGKI